MKRALSVIAAASLTACGGSSPNQPLTAEEARGALPTEGQAKIAAPDSAALAGAPRGAEAAGATAPFAVSTIALAAAVNGGVLWSLVIVHAIAALPPTRCEGEACTWGGSGSGGALELNDWRLTVTRKGGTYAWSLAGSPRSRPGVGFVTVLSGEAFPGATQQAGHGDFTLDLDAATASLDRFTDDPGPGSGRIEATYDGRGTPTVGVHFLGTKDADHPGTTVNAAYRYAGSPVGGDLQVASRNLVSGDSFTLRSRWTGAGAGRGDAQFAGAAGSFAESQCWSGNTTRFALVYQASTPAAPSDTGSEASCAFTPAAPPTVAAP